MQRLPNQMVEEAFILSDMFQINEIAALHLLLQGKWMEECFRKIDFTWLWESLKFLQNYQSA